MEVVGLSHLSSAILFVPIVFLMNVSHILLSLQKMHTILNLEALCIRIIKRKYSNWLGSTD